MKHVDYASPPLVEVAISVRFRPNPAIDAAHLGAFWSTVRASYPRVKTVAPIAAPDDGIGGWPRRIQLSVGNEPYSRLQMISSDDQWICQLQPDRLVVNWRKRDDHYPHYDAAAGRFEEMWAKWKDFLNAAVSTDPIIPLDWEVAYVNQVPKEELWKDIGDWAQIFPGLWAAEMVPVPGTKLRGLRSYWALSATDERARLYIESQPAKVDGTDVLVMTLTARGDYQDTDHDAERELSRIRDRLDSGHRLIIKTFETITSAEARQHWGRHGHSQ